MPYSPLAAVLLKRSVALFGTGEAAVRLLSTLPLLPVSYFVDNDPRRQGSAFLGKPVISPHQLLGLGALPFVIVASGSHTAICEQLEHLGLGYGTDFLTVDKLRDAGIGWQRWPPGHFYSPLPSVDAIGDVAKTSDPNGGDSLPGIELNAAGQRALCTELLPLIRTHPFAPDPRPDGCRYYMDNDTFTGLDAVVLQALMRLRKPKRIVEVGSGFSSAAILDTNERFLEGSVELTCIEPHPERLNSLLRTGDHDSLTLMAESVQEVPAATFAALRAGDILFIDGSHVAKAGSDVNYLLFDVLPRLGTGVLVHFHDILYPFEYPRAWLAHGVAWNEAYLLRAFLMYNRSFEIRLWNHFASRAFDELFDGCPSCRAYAGGSLWLEKIS